MYKVASACPFSAGIISSFLLPKVPHSVLWLLNLGKEKAHLLHSAFFFNTGFISLLHGLVYNSRFVPIPPSCALSLLPLWGVSDRRGESEGSPQVATWGWEQIMGFQVCQHRTSLLLSDFPLFTLCFRCIFSYVHAVACLCVLVHAYLPFFPSHHVRPTLTYSSEGLYFKAYLQT